MKRTIISFAVLLAFLAFPAFAEMVSMPPLAMPTAASNGFGGTHVAYTDNVYALFVNPAAIMQVQQWSFFNLSSTMYNPQSTFSLLSPLLEVAKDQDFSSLGDAAEVLREKEGKIALGFEIREFPLSVAYVANGFGLGLWSRVYVNPNIIGVNLEANVYADLMLPVGFAYNLFTLGSHSLDTGVTLKPFARARAAEQVNILELIDDDGSFIDTISVPMMLGFGFDLGLLYRWDIGLSAGLTFSDIVTRGMVVANFVGEDKNTYYVPFTMNLGIAYDFSPARFGGFLSETPFVRDLGLVIAFDWRNMGNAFEQDDYFNRNSALDIGLGLQLSMFEMFMVRVGMNEMLPAVGLGFHFGMFKFDVAYYGKEFGHEPGQLSAAALDISFAIQPDAKPRVWPWTRRSAR